MATAVTGEKETPQPTLADRRRNVKQNNQFINQQVDNGDSQNNVERLDKYESKIGKPFKSSQNARTQKPTERNRSSQIVKNNLYVAHLAPDVTDEKLKELFNQYGTIISAIVKRDSKTGQSLGHGYVCFNTEEEASDARKEMNGKVIGGTKLYVDFRKKKKEPASFRHNNSMMPPPPNYDDTLCHYFNSGNGCKRVGCKFRHIETPIWLTLYDVPKYLDNKCMGKCVNQKMKDNSYVLHPHPDFPHCFTFEFSTTEHRDKIKDYLQKELCKDEQCVIYTEHTPLQAELECKKKANNAKEEEKMQNDEKKIIEITWEWKDDDDSFKQYPKDTMDSIEKANVGEEVMFVTSTWKYKITKMSKDKAVQRNTEHSDQKEREVRKVVTPKINVASSSPLSSFNQFPDWWDQTRNLKPEVQYISINWKNGKTSAERFAENAVNDFYKTIQKDKYEVVEVVLIQNQEMWGHHNHLENNWLSSQRLSKESLNIQMLWHGTGADIVKKICEKGFLRDYTVIHKFGRGVYFAKDAQYPVGYRYAKFDNPDKHAELLYCRVICGESVLGEESYVRPPDKKNRLQIREYESMVNDEINPTIYVSCNDCQAYPCLKLIIKQLK